MMTVRRVFAGLMVLCLASAGAARANTNNSLLDVSKDGTRLLAANTDNDSVSVVDTENGKVLHEIPVGNRPEGVTWVGAGPLAAVTCYFDDAVVLFDAEKGKVVARLKVADEPYGVVADPDGKRLWVTHEYPGVVSEVDVASRKVTREMKAGDFLRGIALSPDRQRLYVTEFYTGKLHALDLASGAVVDSWKGHSTDNLARHVVLHPRRPKAYLSHVRSMIRVINGGGSIFPHLTIYGLTPPDGTSRRTSIAMDTYNGVYVVTNAWEADISPDGKRLYTIYAGTDDMNVNEVVDDDYQEITPVGRAVRLGKNPRAVRVSPDGNKVYVYNAMDFAVSVHDAGMRKLATVKVCEPTKSAEWVLGKTLFNTANAPMSGRRWVSCSSCHPDGHHDGRTWFNPEGMRNTQALFGMAHTHPLHWSADRDEVQDFEFTIRSPLMAGRGLCQETLQRKENWQKVELKQKLTGVARELDALALYSNALEFPPSPHAAGPGKLSEAAERGKAVFFSKETKCATCHSGPYYSDSRLKGDYNIHDVGTGGDDPTEKMGTKYDTPSLLWLYRTAPYLHDGSARTLRDVLTTCNKGDKHGQTSHLSPAQIDDLVEFLKSLPYDTPPAVTDNVIPGLEAALKRE